MPKVMVIVHSSDGPPELQDLIEKYHLKPGEIDHNFGVVEVDTGTYTIQVDDQAAKRMQPTERGNIEGPYANPKIEPFGPPH